MTPRTVTMSPLEATYHHLRDVMTLALGADFTGVVPTRREQLRLEHANCLSSVPVGDPRYLAADLRAWCIGQAWGFFGDGVLADELMCFVEVTP